MFFVLIALSFILGLSGIASIQQHSGAGGCIALILGIVMLVCTVIHYQRKGYIKRLADKCDDCIPNDFLCGFAFGDCVSSLGDCDWLPEASNCEMPSCDVPDCNCD